MAYLSPEVYAGIDLSHLTGLLPIHMTNDYLFRAIMQENNHILKALVCSLLRLDESEVHDIRIQNPIELGRSFDNLNKGRDYRNVLPAVQIGILDYTLFPEAPEFYATYRLMNVKSHKIYSDKLRLSVLDLRQIELATEEDRVWQTDSWARFFKASTWREMKQLAERNTIFSEAMRTAAVLSDDEKVRLQCEAREDYYRRTGWKDSYIVQLAYENEQLSSKNEQLSSKNKQLSSKNKQLSSKNERLSSENRQLSDEIRRLNRLLEDSGISVGKKD